MLAQTKTPAKVLRVFLWFCDADITATQDMPYIRCRTTIINHANRDRDITQGACPTRTWNLHAHECPLAKQTPYKPLVAMQHDRCGLVASSSRHKTCGQGAPAHHACTQQGVTNSTQYGSIFRYSCIYHLLYSDSSTDVKLPPSQCSAAETVQKWLDQHRRFVGLGHDDG